MITLARDYTMDLRGSYFDDDVQLDEVPCELRIGSHRLPLNVPADALEEYRFLGADQVSLRIPGEKSAPVSVQRLLTDEEQAETGRWIAEMESFDGF